MRQAIIFNRHRKMRALKAARVIGDRLVDRKEEKLVNLVLNCRVLVTFLAIFSLIALSGSQSLAGPFISYPGARARAMGGAFTGIADDASAVWFNPAGLAQEKDEEGITDVIIDWSQAASIDEKDGPLRSDENAWFVGGKFNYEEFGIGLYYYTPYSIKYWAYDQGQNDAAWGKVNEIVQTIGIPAAVSLIDGRLKLGATIDLVHLSIHDSRVYYRDNWGWVDAYPTAKENTNGLAGSLGTLITLIDNKPRSFDLKLGGTYRLKSQTDIGAAALKAGEDVAVAQLFFDRPESFDVGVSFTKTFPAMESALVLATQYGSTDWGGARKEKWEIKYEKISFGAEYAINRKDAILKKKAFRIGYYTSKPSEHGRVWNWPDVQGITYGIGIAVGYDSVRFGLDLTQERRSLINDAGYSDKATLTSIAIACSF